jgi:ribonuclease E
MEAATEIARQLRLRDLGGIIVIDFIDMINKKHIQDVERTLKAAMKRDRARTKVSRMSLLGLLELSRQRLRPSLGEGEFHDCPLCEGTGRLRAPETTSLYAFRKIKAILAKGDIKEVRATVPSQVADHLLNFMRAELFELESQHGSRIVILGKSNLPDSQMTVESVKEDEAHATATTRVIELLEPPPDIIEPAEEQPVLQEAGIAANPEEIETKAPKKRRRSRKKTKPIEEKMSLLEETDESLELVSETLEVSINSKTELEANPLSNAENNSTEAIESDSDVHGQESKEEILSKDRPRRKATLQDYLPFS